jgi:hypothetical protein
MKIPQTPIPVPLTTLATPKRKLGEAEILQELQDKGKFDEWVKFGRLYGLTSDNSHAKFFVVRPFIYRNIDDTPVAVSMVQSTFRPDVDNIAVFQQVHKKKEIDPCFVAQGTHKFVSVSSITSFSCFVTYGFVPSDALASKYLYTSCLATCSSLAMVIGTRKFMTHLDARTRTEPILADLWRMIQEEQISPETLRPTICTGALDSTITEFKAMHICGSLRIPYQNVYIQSVCMFDTVVI